MKRRAFIQQTSLLGGAAIVVPSLMSASKKQDFKLVILHTNDTHSNIDPFPENHGKYPKMGGVSKRASLVKQIRAEEEQVLLLDAGDIFQGTPYFNKFKGVLEMKTMSEIGYDVATLGNHDFDIGLQGFINAKQHANFPFVNANYDFSKTLLNNQILPNTILKRGKLKIGIFGLGVDFDGLVSSENTGGTIYNEPIKVAQEQVTQLKKKGCDFIICLSHLGYEYPTNKVSDKVLAANTEGIHLILGGHTHTFLTEPTLLKNKAGKDVIVNQVGYGGLYLGRLDVYFSEDNQFTVQSKAVELV